MVGIEYLVSTDKEHAIRGNHRKQPDGDFVSYIYHWTVICQTMPGNTFWANNRGWNTQSTNRAVNAYRRALIARGFTELPVPNQI